MPRIKPEHAGGKNVCAFLDMIAHSELGAAILAQSDDGYNVLVGSLPGHLKLFGQYTKHPRTLVFLPHLGIESSAAGRYQFIWPTWHKLQQAHGYTDFGPLSQDCACIQTLHDAGALPFIEDGDFAKAVAAVSHVWASLPGAGYGQHENHLAVLRAVYQHAGGEVA